MNAIVKDNFRIVIHYLVNKFMHFMHKLTGYFQKILPLIQKTINSVKKFKKSGKLIYQYLITIFNKFLSVFIQIYSKIINSFCIMDSKLKGITKQSVQILLFFHKNIKIIEKNIHNFMIEFKKILKDILLSPIYLAKYLGNKIHDGVEIGFIIVNHLINKIKMILLSPIYLVMYLSKNNDEVHAF
jgi:hypothetical protein